MSKVNEILDKIYLLRPVAIVRPSKKVEEAKQQLLAEVLDMITTNQKGTFTDDGGNDCWYIDELVRAAKERFKR